MTMELIFMIMASSLSLGGEQSTSAKKGDQSARPSSESNSRQTSPSRSSSENSSRQTSPSRSNSESSSRQTPPSQSSGSNSRQTPPPRPISPSDNRPGTNIPFENGSVITPRPNTRPPAPRPISPSDNRPGTRPTVQGPSSGNGTRPTAQGPSSGNGMRPTAQDPNPPSDNRPGTNFDFTEGSVITPRASQANGNRPITTARPIITTPVTPPAGNRPITTARSIITTPVTLSNNPPGTSFAEPDIKQMIIGHEGSIEFPYKDSRGLWTIGVGHLIGDGKSLPPEYSAYKNNGGPNDKNNNKTPAMTESQIQELFNKDYEKHKKIAMRTPGWELANDRGKAAMIDLAFNMGAWHEKEVDGKLEWKNTVAALERGDFEAAAEGLSNSRWYKQVKDRGPTIVEMIRNGKKN